jgi:hypothetical protein
MTSNQEKHSIPSGLAKTTNEHNINMQNMSLNSPKSPTPPQIHGGQANHGWNNLRSVFSNYDREVGQSSELNNNDQANQAGLVTPKPNQTEVVSQNNLLTVNFPLTKNQRQQLSELSYKSKDHRKSFLDKSFKQRRQSAKEHTNSLNSSIGIAQNNSGNNNNILATNQQQKTLDSVFDVMSNNCIRFFLIKMVHRVKQNTL